MKILPEDVSEKTIWTVAILTFVFLLAFAVWGIATPYMIHSESLTNHPICFAWGAISILGFLLGSTWLSSHDLPY